MNRKKQLISIQREIRSANKRAMKLLLQILRTDANTCFTLHCDTLFDFATSDSGGLVNATLTAVFCRENRLYKMGEADNSDIYTDVIYPHEAADIIQIVLNDGVFFDINEQHSRIMYAERGDTHKTLISYFPQFRVFFPPSEICQMPEARETNYGIRLKRDEAKLLLAPIVEDKSLAAFLGITIMYELYSEEDDEQDDSLDDIEDGNWAEAFANEKEYSLANDPEYQNFEVRLPHRKQVATISALCYIQRQTQANNTKKEVPPLLPHFPITMPESRFLTGDDAEKALSYLLSKVSNGETSKSIFEFHLKEHQCEGYYHSSAEYYVVFTNFSNDCFVVNVPTEKDCFDYLNGVDLDLIPFIV